MHNKELKYDICLVQRCNKDILHFWILQRYILISAADECKLLKEKQFNKMAYKSL